MMRIVAFSLLFFFYCSFSHGQEDYSLLGSLKVTNYSQKDYKANAQIFCITQRENGVMYFANQRGVLEYDGTKWKTLPLPDKAESLELLTGEHFLIANTSGLGEFVPNEKGKWEYKDLNEFLEGKVSRLHNVVQYNDFYVVSNFEKVIVLSKSFELIDEYTNVDNNTGTLTILDDGVYFRGENGSLMKYGSNGFELVWKYHDADDNQIIDVLQFNGSHIAVTELGTLYIIDNGMTVKAYENEDITIKSALAVDDQYLAIGTYIDGIIILDKYFDPVYAITTDKGLIDGTILCQYVDAEKNLWLGTSNGISKVDLMSPITTFESVFDDATIEDIAAYRDGLFLATGGGAYKLGESGSISKITGIVDDCYGLNVLATKRDTSLYVSALYDLFKYDGGMAESIAQGGPYNVKQSPFKEDQFVVLHYDGIQLLEYANGTYRELVYLQNFSNGEPFNFVITEAGDVWIGTKPNDGVYKINLSDLSKGTPEVKHFYTGEGLPIGQTYLFDYEGEVFCATNVGVYKYADGKFSRTSKFGVDFDETGQGVHRINADPAGNVWMVLFKDDDNTYEIGYAAKAENYKWHSEFFSGYDEYIVHAVYHQDNNVSWFGGPGGLMRFDKKRVSENVAPFSALIREVGFGGELLYGGNGEQLESYELAYGSKDKVEFVFAANSFKSEDKTQFSWMLVGFDDEWSEWSSMNKEDYSLLEGTYTFKVRARNAKGEISQEASFTFTILPPWYRTWWAYLLFIALLAVVVYVLIMLSIRRVKQQNIKLEKIVEERTEEVVAQKAEAEKQRDIAEHQKHLIEEKNMEILDSINYAKRLQNAILTPVKTIYDTFQESFILYLPKDIVAGDFYWTNLARFNKREKRNMIAAADCTGHGVPGAMVSVVCSNALDRSVKEFGFTKPADVLDKTTDLVIETFEKSEDEVKDGMDISLCSFEQKEDHMELQYAGANNSLWIVTKRSTLKVNGVEEVPVMEENGINLFEVKATKQPVGKYMDRKSFENNVIELQKEDTVYMFTDGYADQFGGPKGKKYKYKPFKRFLISVSEQDLQTQMTGLHDEFNRWKADYEQIDDVCVIGVRV